MKTRKMKTRKTHTTGLMTLMACLASCTLTAQTIPPSFTTFGSNNSGYDGFNQDTTDILSDWTNEAEGVRFTNSGLNDGQVNSSLLKEYTLNRTSGSQYLFTGVVDWINTYAADNNRLGISLFASTDDITGIDSGVSLQYNLGDGSFLIRSGVNGGSNSSATYNGLSGADAIGTTFTFAGLIEFDGSDVNIDFTLTDENSFSQTLTATVLAADVTGEYFGFGTRGRVRGTIPGTNDAPFTYEAKSFEVSVIPEPSTLALFGVALAFLAHLRRRK